MIKKICQQCGKEFEIYPCQIKNNEGKFCSYKCHWESKKKRVWIICKNCGKRFWIIKSRIKKAKFCSHKCAIENRTGETGKKARHYIDGRAPKNHLIRSGRKMKLWRKAIFTRDNYTCQKCKIKGYKIAPHHIFNFAQFINFRFELFNGITFCEKCHKEFHKIYGQLNNNKEQLNEFLKRQ